MPVCDWCERPVSMDEMIRRERLGWPVTYAVYHPDCLERVVHLTQHIRAIAATSGSRT